MAAAGRAAARMRYTKAALLIFGLGILLGLVVVAAELGRIERVASGVMAIGLVLLPIAFIADGRAAVRLPFRKRAKPRRATRRRRASARRRVRR